jgi:16S rRNA (cytosine967-C5)-methyltransferase
MARRHPNGGPEAGPADPARAGALALLRGVLEEGRPLGEAGATPAEAARARRLAHSALRHRSRGEAALTPFLARRPAPAVQALLVLAAAEMLAEGAPAHAVVSDAVALARGLPGGARVAGMVNAVLRRVAAEGRPAWDAAGPPRMPGWLRGRVSGAFGGARTAAIEAAQEAGAPLDLAAARDPGAWADRLGGALLPTGSVRLPGGQVSALAGHAEGAWWVQDAAAALPARMLGVRPGERVLDLCAAPGGKTMQLAAAGARVTALDASEARMERLRENLVRTGLRAEVVVADALDWEAAPFDAVLLDAPCSATGTIRRHPELPLIRGREALAGLAALQAALIDRAVGLTRPGGRLVYAVCSLLPEEGQGRVAAALERHPGLGVEPVDLPGTGPGWWRDGMLRTAPDLWPGHGGVDGFQAALLRRG